MWLKKLKHKKIQFLLVGIMLLAIATVISTCIGFTLELKTYANNRFSKEHSPDVYVYSQNNVNQEDNFPEASVRKNIESISVLKGKSITVPMKHNDTNISSITNMWCTLDNTNIKKYMDIIEGDKKSIQPREGEIWIPKTLASSYDIKIGDKLTITYDRPIEMTVTAMYTSTFAPSERLTIMPNIVNDETLKMVKDEPAAGILALNLYDTSKDSLNKLAMSNPYALLTLSREKLSDYITNISGIVGGVSAIAALIVFLAALFIISFIITNDLRKELRSIGIYKSLGYSSEKIMGIYIKAYMLVGTVAIMLGTLMSLPLLYSLGASTSEALGGFSLTGTTVVVCMVTIAILMLLLWCGAMLSLNKVKNITPVEAMSAGQALGEQKLTHSIVRNAKSPFTMAINDIFKHKKTSAVTTMVLAVCIYLILFFASSYYTCGNIYKNANVWVACPKFNAMVTGQVSEAVASGIRSSGYAKSAISGNFFYYPPIKIPQYDGNARAIEFVVLDDAKEDITGIAMKEGYGPGRREEIAVSLKLLKELHMQIGDYLQIGISDNKKEFKISGTFASMEERGIIMTVAGMKLIDKSYTPDNVFVTMKDGTDFKAFQKYVENHYSGVSVDLEWNALKAAMLAIEKMLTSVMKVMLIVFILFAVISIVNVLAITISSKRRQYGILKSLGFTTSYMLLQNLFHILIMFGIGTVIAIILHLAFSKTLFAALVIDALINSVTLSCALLLGTLLLVILVTLILSLQIRKITPVDLMEE